MLVFIAKQYAGGPLSQLRAILKQNIPEDIQISNLLVNPLVTRSGRAYFTQVVKKGGNKKIKKSKKNKISKKRKKTKNSKKTCY